MDETRVPTKKTSIKTTVARYRDLIYVGLSLFMVFMIFINSSMVDSLIIGCFTSVVYILVNGYFLGHSLFEESDLRLLLGVLLLIALLGIVGWPFVIFVRLTIREVIIVLCITSFFSFAFKKHAEIKAMVAKTKQYVGKILA